MKGWGIIEVMKRLWQVHPVFLIELWVVLSSGFFIGVFVGAFIQKFSC